MRIVRALRAAGIDSLPQLRAMRRTALLDLPGLGAHGYDYVNDALNHDDRLRLAALVAPSQALSPPTAPGQPTTAAEVALATWPAKPAQRSG
jgi:hypothetical protein